MRNVVYFELKYWIRNPLTWVFSSMALCFGVILFLGNAGYFGGEADSSLVTANSPYNVWRSASMFFKLLLFVIPATVGHAAAKDFSCRIHPLMAACPINRAQYALAKYTVAAFLILLFALLFLGGFALAASFWGGAKFKGMPFDSGTYGFQLFLIYIPNIFFITAWVYAVVYLTRDVIYGYFVVVSLFILKEIFSRFLLTEQGSDALFIADPFADFILQQQSGHWSLQQKNNEAFSPDIRLGLNRVFWALTAALTLLTSVIPHKYARLPRLFKRKVIQREREIITRDLSWSPASSFNPSIFNVWTVAKTEYLSVLRTRGFQLVLLLGGVFLYVLLSQMNAPFGVKLLPATWLMLAFPVLFISLQINFVTFLYAGILINRDRMFRMDSLTDIAPVHNGFFALSKLITLSYIQVTLLLLVAMTGILVQVSSGYYKIEALHYLMDLLCIHFPGFLIWSFMALAVHQLLKNNWAATVLLILLYFGIQQSEVAGIKSHLLKYNSSPYDNFFLYYSDFTSYGHSILPFFIYKFYWLLTGILFFVFSVLIWRRGYHTPLTTRIRIAVHRIFNQQWKVILPLLIAAFATAFFIRQNEGYLKTEAELNEINREADKRYAGLSSKPQPRITHVVLHLDIYPDERKFNARGTFILENRTHRAIDTLIISRDFEVMTRYGLSRAGSVIETDNRHNVDVFRLDRPLLPGDTLQFTFHIESFDDHIFDKNSAVEKNGTYLTSTFLPVIGYRLRTKLLMPEDSLAARNHYRSSDADFVLTDITISTAGHQIPLSTGRRVSSWEENGRRYARFKSGRQVTHDYCFLSGDYAVRRELYQNKLIEVYHHPRHTENLENLLTGIKETLKYGEEKYGYYPDKHLRLVEFPRNIGEFAQSFAGIIPYSELGFMVDVGADLTQNINLPFLGAAHEMAHQWWGMQVVPADASGSRFITEGMAEFTAYRVYRSYYGEDKAALIPAKAHTILVNQMRESLPEPEVLKYCSGKLSFIAYQKALLSLNAMSLILGREKFDEYVKSFYQKQAQVRTAPYTRSIDFAAHIGWGAGPRVKQWIEEYVATNSVYNNAIYRVNKSDSLTIMIRGNPGSAEVLPVQLGIYYSREALSPDEYKTFFFPQGRHRLSLILSPEAKKVVLDPDFLMVDLNRKDNVIFTR